MIEPDSGEKRRQVSVDYRKPGPASVGWIGSGLGEATKIIRRQLLHRAYRLTLLLPKH